ncbi:acyltransferase family protein [Polaribacter sargassicola]|uniref:acyltransferase family protein n=1 Tax=Polaribacter sargassicola TaxID=2836891 RepID=UPI001F24C299|nr:acyltransferase [Polaribacter sp. DS7-9]MCG1035930.1 acyltransferase [Polaribacter sp. DS7-9]
MGLLRLLLALCVLVAHSGAIFGFGLVTGKTALHSFFVISGFYMALILNEKYIGQNNSYKLFITNRLLRLYPIYWVVALCTILFSVIMYFITGNSFGPLQPYVDYYDSMNFGTLLFLILTNIIIFFQDIVMFLGLDTVTGSLFFTKDFRQTEPALYNFLLAPQAWTVGLELIFYLMAPFIVRRKVKFIAVLLFISLAIRVVLYLNGYQKDPWAFRFFPSEIFFFLLGTLSYNIYKKVKTMDIKTSTLKIIYGFILVFSLFYSFIPYIGSFPTYPHFPLKSMFYIFCIFLSIPFIFILSKRWKRDRYIGELSYPVYLSHILVLNFIRWIDVPLFNTYTSVFLSIFSIIFSIFLTELVTNKLEDYRQRRVKVKKSI